LGSSEFVSALTLIEQAEEKVSYQTAYDDVMKIICSEISK